MAVFLRLPERENGIDDTLYSNLKKCLSNVPRKRKKNGARCQQSAAAPLLYSNHSFSLAFLRMVSFAALTKSAIIRISYSSQSETRSCISCEKYLWSVSRYHIKTRQQKRKGHLPKIQSSANSIWSCPFQYCSCVLWKATLFR